MRRKKQEEFKWRKKKFHSGTLISVGILSGNSQRTAKHIGLKLNRKVWNKEVFGRLHHINGRLNCKCGWTLIGRICGMRRGSRK